LSLDHDNNRLCGIWSITYMLIGSRCVDDFFIYVSGLKRDLIKMLSGEARLPDGQVYNYIGDMYSFTQWDISL